MHVAYLIPTIDRIGGAERQVIELAIGMAQRGWHVTVIALSGHGDHAAQVLSANNVSFLSLEMRRGLADFRGWNRLHRWICSAQPEVLHAHLPHGSLMARGIRLAAPVRVVVETIHSPATGGLSRKILYRLTSQLPTVITAVSRAAAAPWLRAGIVDRSKLAILPNGIDTAYWKRDDELRNHSRLQSASNDEFHWLAVGRLDPVKDHATMLRAFSMLPETARLTIAGTGPLESSLRILSGKLRLDGRVSFIGFQKDVRHCMQKADGFVLSSRWEGLPLALMEASACELPSVFTGTAGSCELLPDSPISPVLVAQPAALAATMQAVMKLSHAELRRIGAMARREITSRLDLGPVLCSFEKLYCHMLAVNPRPARCRPSNSPLQAPSCSSNPER